MRDANFTSRAPKEEDEDEDEDEEANEGNETGGKKRTRQVRQKGGEKCQCIE